MLLVSGLSGDWLRLYQSYGANVGFLTTPRAKHSVETVLVAGVPYAMDNDCFVRFNRRAYEPFLERFQGVQPAPLWVTAPDVFGNAAATLEQFEQWEPVLHGRGYPVALVAQDGLDRLTVPWERIEALFLGASNAWRFGDAAVSLMVEARRRGKWLHIGRVNSLDRMEWCARMGADSIDGSGFSRFGKLIKPGCRWLKRAVWLAGHQPLLFQGENL